MKKIVITGGGTGGHVVPNIALFETLRAAGFELHYLGSKNEMEFDLISQTDVPFYHVTSGKLSRYVTYKNFITPFKVFAGLLQAMKHLMRIKPRAVFSKGGFISVPVVFAAKLLRIPVVIHESDRTPGLANRIAGKFADKICVSFEHTLNFVPRSKAVWTGTPLRQMIFTGNKTNVYDMYGFTPDKPIIFIMGGSLGAVAVNKAIWKSLDHLLLKFQIIHQCGKGNTNPDIKRDGYVQMEFIREELPHVFAATDIMIARAGANSIFEFLALEIPMLLVPLPGSGTSRGDQLENSEYFKSLGYAEVMQQVDITPEKLTSLVQDMYEKRDDYKEAMRTSKVKNGTENIVKVIEGVLK